MRSGARTERVTVFCPSLKATAFPEGGVADMFPKLFQSAATGCATTNARQMTCTNNKSVFFINVILPLMVRNVGAGMVGHDPWASATACIAKYAPGIRVTVCEVAFEKSTQL